MERATIDGMDNKIVLATGFAIAVSAGISYLMAFETRPIDRTEHLQSEVNELAVKMDSLGRIVEKQFGEFAGRLVVSGITDEKDESIRRWWCADRGLCSRTERECLAISPKCFQTRVAFCFPVPPKSYICADSLESCATLSPECIGVE